MRKILYVVLVIGVFAFFGGLAYTIVTRLDDQIFYMLLGAITILTVVVAVGGLFIVYGLVQAYISKMHPKTFI